MPICVSVASRSIVRAISPDATGQKSIVSLGYEKWLSRGENSATKKFPGTKIYFPPRHLARTRRHRRHRRSRKRDGGRNNVAPSRQLRSTSEDGMIGAIRKTARCSTRQGTERDPLRMIKQKQYMAILRLCNGVTLNYPHDGGASM
jgi:hypothetical protein